MRAETALLIVILVAIASKRVREAFLSVLFIEDKVRLDIVVPRGEFSKSINILAAKAPRKFRVVDSASSATPFVHYTNITQLQYGDRALACTDDITTACFVKGFFSPMRGEDVSELPGFRVGYVHDHDLKVAHALLTSCAVSPPTIRFIKQTVEEVAAELEKPSATDAAFLFANLDDPRYKEIVSQKLTILTMVRTDHDIARLLLPHAMLRDMDVRKRFSNITHPTRPIRLIADFNNIIVKPPAADSTYLHEMIGEYFKHNADVLNHLARFHHGRVQETFEEPTMVFKPKHNVPGYFDHMSNVFEMRGDVLDGTPLQKNDLVLLNNQEHTHERGSFVVEKIEDGTSLLRRKYAVREPRDPFNDDTFICVTNPAIKYREECLSPRDRYGKPKPEADVWDAPCVISEECPFYQRNRNYKNYRGGCIDGYCEMPLGVRRVGFKQYSGRPVCHNCPANRLDCCDDQARADYAFPRDNFEREAQGQSSNSPFPPSM